MNQKVLIRKVFLRRRKFLSLEKTESLNSLIQKGIKEFRTDFSNKYVHIFLPIKKNNEVDTWPIIEFIKHKNGTPIVSSSDLTDNKMTHFIYTDDLTFVENKWGIPEPTIGEKVEVNLIDIVFIPLLAFDNCGNRVGYGKGYYDRFLSNCRSDCEKIGLSFSPPMQKILGMEPSDVKMDYCISPMGLHNFKKL